MFRENNVCKKTVIDPEDSYHTAIICKMTNIETKKKANKTPDNYSSVVSRRLIVYNPERFKSSRIAVSATYTEDSEYMIIQQDSY